MQPTHASVAAHIQIPAPSTVSELSATPALATVATLPATATLPAVAALPATAALPAVAALPATATLPAVAALPATARLPAVATLPTTELTGTTVDARGARRNRAIRAGERQEFLRGERRDSNPRPPGPQPGKVGASGSLIRLYSAV